MLVVVGLAALVFGADQLVTGAAAIALVHRVSATLVGLTIVSVGTSLPELVVSVQAALSGSASVAVANVAGSNIYNIALILGICAVMRSLSVDADTARRHAPSLVGATAVAVLLAFDGQLSRIDGCILLALQVAYFWWLFRRTRVDVDVDVSSRVSAPWLRVAGGLLLLIGGGWALVTGAVEIANALGVPERIIGLTLVAIGTSLPELATSVAATWRGQDDVAVANVVGSNLFNILGILGAASLISPLDVEPALARLDLPFGLLLAVIVVPLLMTGARVSRGEGVVLLTLGAGYTAWIAG